MGTVPRKKFFYQIEEVSDRLGLSLLDIAALASERKLQVCATVGRLQVEEGRYEAAPDGRLTPIPGELRYVQGLVDLRPEDAWYVLRAGSETISWLASADGCYRRLVSTHDDERGYTVIREEVGVRHEELKRYVALDTPEDEAVLGGKFGFRGSQPQYNWDAARLEACRFIYFEGVPESYGALIRHIEAWFAAQGGRVPDESTLKRRLRDIWATFGPEAESRAS